MNLLSELRPIQAMAAALFFKHKKLLLNLPRQFGGKTELGVRLARSLTSVPSPSTWMFVAKNTASRRKATREKFLRLFDQRDFHINTEMIYLKRCPTSQILTASVDKDPDAQRGGTLNGIHWSEVAFSKIDHGETIPDVWLKVFRPMLTQTDGYALLESTNNGQNGWKELWDDYKALGFVRLRVPLSQMLEMGLLTAEEFEKERSETHPLIFAQEFECEFVTFLGRAYDEFEETKHVGDVSPPEEWQHVIAGIDWGFRDATCVLLGYVKDGITCIFDEIYATEQRIEDTYASLKARLEHWKIERFTCVADHDPLRNEELTRRGISTAPADKVNVLGNRLQIKEKLWNKTILIHPRCKFLIKDLTYATWHAKKEGELDDSMCAWGHWDAESALRYLVRALDNHEAEEPVENPHVGLDEASARAWEIHHAFREVDA